MLWNVPGTYRKYFLSNFNNQIVPAGFKKLAHEASTIAVATVRKNGTLMRKCARNDPGRAEEQPSHRIKDAKILIFGSR